MWTVFFRLLLAHLVADFVLQPDSWIEDRRRRGWLVPTLWLHALISAGLAYALVWRWEAWWLLPVVFGSHLILDAAKTRTDYGARAFLVDQAGHVLVALGCAMWLTGSPAVWARAAGLSVAGSKAFWVLLTVYVLILGPVGRLVGLLTEPFRKQIEAADERRAARLEGLPRAGMWIGQLERFLVLTFVLVGRYEAIGFLVAAKSILRFGEIRDARDRKEVEYILIGTMLSYALAIVAGLAVLHLLGT